MPTKKKSARRPAKKTRAKSKAGTKTKKLQAKPVAKGGARKKKRAPARKQPRTTVAKSKSPKSAARPTGPLVLDEVLEESLVDVSTILRVKDRVARSQRDVDEDELEQFPDPSLVVDIVTVEPRREDEATGESELPGLFEAEARLQKQRAADRAADSEPNPHTGSLFGTLGSTPDDRDED